MSNVEEEISDAVRTLCRSEKGRQSLACLYELADRGGATLDLDGQLAVMTLLSAVFAGPAGYALNEMRSALALEDG